MIRAILAASAVAAVATAAPPPKEAPGKLPPPTAEQLKRSRENLKRIMLAVHNYFDNHGAFPNNTSGNDGKPLLSWRVHLLPHMDDAAAAKLHAKFKLDEPWDSEANLKLLRAVPAVYAPVRVGGKDGHTFYRGFDGPGTVFERGKKIGLLDITDGSSNTIGVVEAGESVAWTKPDDLAFDPDKELPKLGGLFDGAFHVGMCDGSVRKAKPKPDAKKLAQAISKDDGSPIDTDDLFEDD